MPYWTKDWIRQQFQILQAHNFPNEKLPVFGGAKKESSLILETKMSNFEIEDCNVNPNTNVNKTVDTDEQDRTKSLAESLFTESNLDCPKTKKAK